MMRVDAVLAPPRRPVGQSAMAPRGCDTPRQVGRVTLRAASRGGPYQAASRVAPRGCEAWRVTARAGVVTAGVIGASAALVASRERTLFVDLDRGALVDTPL
jgi:hypothetical protein